MPRRALPKAPELRQAALQGMPAPFVSYMREVARWTADMQTNLEQRIAEVIDSVQQPQLPVALPTLLTSELTGTRLRAGGPPALAAVPDAPGGLALAMRDGTTWELLNRPITRAAYLAADDTGLTSATPSDITGMSIATQATHFYDFELRFRVTTSAATSGLGIAVVPTNITAFGINCWFPQGTDAATASANFYTGGRMRVGSTVLSNTDFPSSTGSWVVFAIGYVQAGANDGSIKLQGCNEAGAGTVTPKAGTSMVLIDRGTT